MSTSAKRSGFQRRAVSLLLGLSIGLAAAVSGCSTPGKDRVAVTFVREDGTATAPFSMEIAADDARRRRGLMFRKSLGAKEGMIFVFPEDDDHSFWMKNTLIPLDIVFVSSDWQVVGALEEVPPLSEVSRSVGMPSRYVLEFAAGTMKREGVRAGTRVKLEGTLPAAR